MVGLSVTLFAQKKDVDYISKGSVWFNTPYPITIENIHDKILVVCLWDEQNPFSTEGLHRIEKTFESKFNVQLISGILGNSQQPRSRRRYTPSFNEKILPTPWWFVLTTRVLRMPTPLGNFK